MIPFKDLNFKLHIINHLLEDYTLYKEFNSQISQYLDTTNDFSGEPVPELLRFCEKLELTPEMLASITVFNPDGGDTIYSNLVANWDGEDNFFDIQSLDDVQWLPNLAYYEPSAMVSENIDLTPLLSCENLKEIRVFEEDFNKAIPFLAKRITVNNWGTDIIPIRFANFSELKNLIPKDNLLLNSNKFEDDSLFLLIDGNFETQLLDLDAPFVDFENRYHNYQVYLDQEIMVAIIINGNLKANSIFNYNTDGSTNLFVLGNLVAENIIVGGQEIYVAKNLKVNQLFWGDYNHGDLVVKGKSNINYVLQTDEYHLPENYFDKKDKNVQINHLFLENNVPENPIEFSKQYFVATIFNNEIENWPDCLNRKSAIELVKNNESIVYKEPKIKEVEQIPSLFSDSTFTDENSLQNQIDNFDKLIDLIPINDSEQAFDSSNVLYPCQIFISQTHTNLEGKNVDAAITILGEDNFEFYFWRREINPLKRLVGSKKPLIAYYKNIDKNIFTPVSIFNQPDLVIIMQNIWKEILERAEKGSHYFLEFYDTVKADEIIKFVELPIVQEEYNDWFKGDKNAFWRGNYNFCFRTPQTEDEQIAIVRVGKENTKSEEFDMISFDFRVDCNEIPNRVKLHYKNTQNEEIAGDRYSKYGANVSLFDSHLIKKAIQHFKIAQKSIPAENKEYLYHKKQQDKEAIKVLQEIEKLRNKKFTKPYQNVVVSGVNFQVIDIHEAHQLIGELTNFDNNALYDVYSDSWRFPTYEDNPYLLLCDQEVEAESFELAYSTDDNPDIFILGYIFTKKIVSKSFIVAHDTDNSPALIALSDVLAQNIHLFGNVHYIGGNLTCEVVMGEYNHGELHVKGTLYAYFAYADDMQMYFSAVNALFANYGDTIYATLPIALEDGTVEQQQLVLPNSCNPTDIFKSGLETIENIGTSMIDLNKVKKYEKQDFDDAFTAIFENYEEKISKKINNQNYQAQQFGTTPETTNLLISKTDYLHFYRIDITQNPLDKSFILSIEYYADDTFSDIEYSWELQFENSSILSRIIKHNFFETVGFLLETPAEIVEITENMINKNANLAFRNQFGTYKIPSCIEKILYFSNESDFDTFSDGFYLDDFDKKGLETYSSNPEFYDAFIEFAKANGTGSTYAFWLLDDDLEKCPVVVFGDEGGIFAVAENCLQLIQLLTFDVEISINRTASFYKDEEEYEESDMHFEFIDFVESQFNLEAIKTEKQTNEITERASSIYQEKLNVFLNKFDIENEN